MSLGGDEEFFKEMCEFIESEVVPERARLHSLLRLTFSSDKRYGMQYSAPQESINTPLWSGVTIASEYCSLIQVISGIPGLVA